MPEPYSMPSAVSPPPRPPASTRGQRFLASRYWLILKNVLGWTLILLAFVAGPLIPGPGGIPLFLIGFALISFRGKRRLTARVLRGKPIRFRRKQFMAAITVIALALAATVFAIARIRPRWREAVFSHGLLLTFCMYLITMAAFWLV